jgi:hypothetical protein
MKRLVSSVEEAALPLIVGVPDVTTTVLTLTVTGLAADS